MIYAEGNLAAHHRYNHDMGCVPIAADRTEAVLNLIMKNAPLDEPLPVSVSRLSRAVGSMGYVCVTAASAFHAYRTFPQLGKALQ